MKRCRMEGVSESDIKVITAKLAKLDKEFENISEVAMEKTEITSGSKGVIIKIVRKHFNDNEESESIIEEGNECGEEIISESSKGGRESDEEDCEEGEDGNKNRRKIGITRNSIVYRRQKAGETESNEIHEESSEEEENDNKTKNNKFRRTVGVKDDGEKRDPFGMVKFCSTLFGNI